MEDPEPDDGGPLPPEHTTEAGIRVFSKIVRFVAVTNPAIPYKWNRKLDKMVFRPHKFYSFAYGFGLLTMFAYTGYTIRGCYKVWKDPNSKTEMKFYMLTMVERFVFFTVMNCTFFRHFGEHHTCCNAFFDFLRKFQGEFGYRKPSRSTVIVLWVFLVAYIAVISSARLIFKNPGELNLLSSLAQDPSGLSLRVKLVLFFLQMLINAFQLASICISGGMMTLFILIPVRVLDRFIIADKRWTCGTVLEKRAETKSKQSSSSAVSQAMTDVPEQENKGRSEFRNLSLDDVVRKFQEYKVLEAALTNVLGSSLLTYQIHFICIVSLCAFQAIVFSKAWALILGLTTGSMLLNVTKHASAVNEVSAEGKQSWRSVNGPRWFSKWCRAARPARIPLGSFFYYDRGLRLTLLDLVLSTTIDFIITYT